MRLTFVAILALTLIALTSAKKAETPAVNWLTFEQAVEKAKTEKRPIFIDVYTDWCGWCKVMDM